MSTADTLGIWPATLALPEQIEQAVTAASQVTDLPSPQDIDHVVMMGMGGSGVAGDVVRSVAAPMMPVPVVVSKGYPCPSFVGKRSLVIAVSFSGNTEETLEAVAAAEMAGAQIVVVTSGGELGAVAAEWGVPVYDVDSSIPMPRVGVGAVSVPPLMALERIGLFPGATEWIELAVRQLRTRRDVLDPGGELAVTIADAIADTVPLIYGGGELGGVAAARWKNQVNENAQSPAFHNEMPELCHNELAGWGATGSGAEGLSVIQLRHDHEHPQIARRFEYTADVISSAVAGIHEVQAGGVGQLAQLFDLMFIGDQVSLHLAAARDVDPGPIAVLDDLKRFLAPG